MLEGAIVSNIEALRTTKKRIFTFYFAFDEIRLAI